LNERAASGHFVPPDAIVAVYFTMQDGKLIRFDKNAGSSIKV
jgi:hypothetical protein